MTKQTIRGRKKIHKTDKSASEQRAWPDCFFVFVSVFSASKGWWSWNFPPLRASLAAPEKGAWHERKSFRSSTIEQWTFSHSVLPAPRATLDSSFVCFLHFRTFFLFSRRSLVFVFPSTSRAFPSFVDFSRCELFFLSLPGRLFHFSLFIRPHGLLKLIWKSRLNYSCSLMAFLLLFVWGMRKWHPTCSSRLTRLSS